MENFGSEIGQKMRSAVKAKLVELGTGGTAGYIDDELPDYVMIMVANKRSKQQMIADLNLFLGSQTELFVTWLHEVLQKLQEVTLPAAIATKKRKADPKQDVSNKKERKSNKKDRKNSTSKKTSEEVQSTAVNTTEKSETSSTPTVPPINSITDVFADVFLEKAKKNLTTTAEAAAHIKKAKGSNKTASSETTKNATTKLSGENSNIAPNTTASKDQRYNGDVSDCVTTNSKKVTTTAPIISGNREKDLAELAEIQKKIYAAKKHLRQLGELDDNSDDEDFINLKEDGTEEEVENLSPKAVEKLPQTPTEQRTNKRRSPIIFDAGEKKSDETKSIENETSDRSAHFTPPPPPMNFVATSEPQFTNSLRSSQPLQQKQHSQEREKSRNREHERDRHETPAEVLKKPVHERLGIRPPAVRDAQQQQQQPRRTREDKQLFVPSFRRKDNDSERDRDRDREKERERERDHDRNKERDREREREKERERERQREREHERERERNRVPARLRGRSEDRRKDRDLERERERPRERGRERSRDPIENRRKGSVPRMRRSLSPILRRTTTNNEQRTLPNITVSAIVKPNYTNKSVSEKQLDEKTNSSASETSTDSGDSSDEESKTTHSPQTQRQRIGSRVIVAPVKQVESSEDEDKSLNSIIKIKPRAPVSPSKQACKTLLLRAVAEAQRSTVVKARHKEEKAVPSKVSNIMKDPTDERKLYTKAYRERLKRGAKVTSTSATSSNLFRRATQNLVIKVESDMPLQKRRRAQIDVEELDAEEQAHSDVEDVEEAEEELEEKYVPGTVFQRVDSNINYMYVPQMIRIKNEEQESTESEDSDEADEDETANAKQIADKAPQRKTQFVVTLNDEKAALKFMSRAKAALKRVRSESPLQEVSSSSSVARSKRAEASSTTTTTTKSTQAPRSRQGAHENEHSRRASIKSRLSAKVMPSSTVSRFSDHESSNSLPATPPLRRSDLVETYRKPKEIKKIIIKNDTDDEEMSPKKLSSTIVVGNGSQQRKHKRTHSVERSTTPPPLRKSDLRKETRTESRTPPKRKRSSNSGQYEGRARDMKHSDEDDDDMDDVEAQPVHKRRSRSDDSTRMRERGREREREQEGHNRERERERAASRDYSVERHSGEERRKISTRNVEAKKYDNIPSLSSVTLDSSAVRVMKTKERCKYHPNCTKQFCDYYHPTAPCKSFPNCKFADKCLYSHPHCKYDLACTNLDCNYAHSGARDPTQLVPQAPPLSSHVVPVQNYKSISATAAANNTMCKYYPTCTKVGCTFYHPKPCRFGKNCINKLECNFYHHEVQSSNKFKWVASVV
ncbi:zinc finger CCCH domain-containing protein 13 [Zeugodacus cucurbitae]|uniref:Zinc finger CCCH domain-containing protein 14 n=1 Tax=Zeugodacus cucurbitae TaxID=28588 RepID=A0A0A1XB26_ZEUCU|nr:zinc finger CCCH domain-containing protein 13 [Zeugodacus cucurbitae]